jgi:predicted acetyltransferase
MTVDVKFLAEAADLVEAGHVFRTALVGARQLPAYDDVDRLCEPGRMLAATVDGDIVGTANSYSSRIKVPGGEIVPHAAVTHVGVLPTHTRRGILSALMRRQLEDFAARGEIIATLRASEAVIYERFGYGIATYALTYDVTRAKARLREGVPTGGPIRLISSKDGAELAEKMHTELGPLWVGAIERYPIWWRFGEIWRSDPEFVAVHGKPGAEDGYVRYYPVNVDRWHDSGKAIGVSDILATTDEAYAALIRHLLTVDLAERIVVRSYQPLDTPLQSMFTDFRALKVTAIEDETWLRIVDVPAALERRTYVGDGSVVVNVTDPILPQNSGSYAISAKGAVRTDGDADLAVDVTTLGALYLGGNTWRQLALAGRVVEHRKDAIAEADDLFRTDRPPFCGTYF